MTMKTNTYLAKLCLGALALGWASPGLAADEALTENPPQPRSQWTAQHPDPPAEYDPRKMERLPEDQRQNLVGIHKRLFPVTEAHYAYGAAVGPDGSVYFTEYNRRNIVRVSPEGKESKLTVKTELFGRGGFYGIAADHEGNVFVALDSDIGNGGILRIEPNGRERFVVTGINRPRQVSCDPHGNVYIVLESENRILRWNRASGETETLVTPDQTRMPQGVVADEAGNIYFSEYGIVGHGGVKLAPGRVRMRTADGTFREIAGGFWRARGMARDAQGMLYLTTEANAWDNSDSGLIVRIHPETGEVERLVQGLNYPQFPVAHPNGRIYVTLAMDNLLVACDPSSEHKRVEAEGLDGLEVYVANGSWTPDITGGEAAGTPLTATIEGLVFKGRVTAGDSSRPVSLWVRVPADKLDIYRGELPYTLPEYPTPGRYLLPTVEAEVAQGSVRALGLPARTHVRCRWPMIIGYKGDDFRFEGREWPAEGFDDTPDAYMVYLQWNP